MFMLNFYYKGFWIEAEVIDQVENGYPELGVTFTSMFTGMEKVERTTKTLLRI